jgi:hypothetical protein
MLSDHLKLARSEREKENDSRAPSQRKMPVTRSVLDKRQITRFKRDTRSVTGLVGAIASQRDRELSPW